MKQKTIIKFTTAAALVGILCSITACGNIQSSSSAEISSSTVSATEAPTVAPTESPTEAPSENTFPTSLNGVDITNITQQLWDLGIESINSSLELDHSSGSKLYYVYSNLKLEKEVLTYSKSKSSDYRDQNTFILIVSADETTISKDETNGENKKVYGVMKPQFGLDINVKVTKDNKLQLLEARDSRYEASFICTHANSSAYWLDDDYHIYYTSVDDVISLLGKSNSMYEVNYDIKDKIKINETQPNK